MQTPSPSDLDFGPVVVWTPRCHVVMDLANRCQGYRDTIEFQRHLLDEYRLRLALAVKPSSRGLCTELV